jgi:hypothetical protein
LGFDIEMMSRCPNCKKKWKSAPATCSCGRPFAFHSFRFLGQTDENFLSIIADLEASNLKESLHYTINQLFVAWQKNGLKKNDATHARFRLSLSLFFVMGYLQNIYVSYGLTLLMFLSWMGWSEKIFSVFFKIRLFRFLSHLWILISFALSYQLITLSFHLLPSLLIAFASSIQLIYGQSLMDKDDFMNQFSRWKKVHGFKNLIEKPTLQTPKPDLQAQALYEYDVPNLLIVDQDIMVDFLVENHFHQRHKVLIFSFQTYPRYMALQARRILAEHGENVQVFIWHRDHISVEEVRDKLKTLGILRIGKNQPKIIELGWRNQDLEKIEQFLGFMPKNFSVFPLDVLFPRQIISLLDQCIEKKLAINHPSIKPRDLRSIAKSDGKSDSKSAGKPEAS